MLLPEVWAQQSSAFWFQAQAQPKKVPCTYQVPLSRLLPQDSHGEQGAGPVSLRRSLPWGVIS